MTDILDAAVGYAERGWHVLPLRPKDKRPLIGGHGVKDATSIVGAVAGQWAITPDANVALATGTPSGFFVVDVDVRNGGKETLDAILAEHGDLPDTLFARTGGGERPQFPCGRHSGFRLLQRRDQSLRRQPSRSRTDPRPTRWLRMGRVVSRPLHERRKEARCHESLFCRPGDR
ncbi:MAG: bifunctional DNA primase/polymerase, partial [Planctomycetes bacterium]|nr:bifunctional DNA primase/polymerase [Planctomycetota bacterium]